MNRRNSRNIIVRKLQSSTLVEVLVGMTLIMITMSIVFPMIVKSQHESGVIERSKATMIGNSILEKTIISKDFTDFTTEEERRIITKTVEKDITNENIRIVKINIQNKKGQILFDEEYTIEVDSL